MHKPCRKVTAKKIYILHAGSPLMTSLADASRYEVTLVDPVVDSKVVRLIRRLHYNYLPIKKWLWIKHRLKSSGMENDESTVIIVFDTDIWMSNIEYLRSKCPKSLIVVWYWNIVDNVELLELCKKVASRVVTFDTADSQKYGLEHHGQFYWAADCDSQARLNNIIYDVVFIGRSKGRLRILENVYSILTKAKKRVFFHVVKDSGTDSSEILNLASHHMPYDEVCRITRKSKCILDIDSPGQSGMTLRILESAFMRKKLITNNKGLVKELLYRRNNILSIDELIASPTVLDAFLESEFEAIDEDVLSKYHVDRWVENLAMLEDD